MDRDVLTDAQWARIEPHCLGKPTDPGRSGRNNRLFMEAVLWIVRTGSPWRDLPERFGNWSTAFRRFRDWREADVFRAQGLSGVLCGGRLRSSDLEPLAEEDGELGLCLGPLSRRAFPFLSGLVEHEV